MAKARPTTSLVSPQRSGGHGGLNVVSAPPNTDRFPPPRSQTLPDNYFPPPPGPSPSLNGAAYPPPPGAPSVPGPSPPPILQHPNARTPGNFSPPPMSAPPSQTTFPNDTKRRPGPIHAATFSEVPERGPQTANPIRATASKMISDMRTMNLGTREADALPSAGFVGAGTTQQDDVGTFNGGSYRISHRDTNTIVTLQLAVGCPITAKPGKWCLAPSCPCPYPISIQNPPSLGLPPCPAFPPL